MKNLMLLLLISSCMRVETNNAGQKNLVIPIPQLSKVFKADQYDYMGGSKEWNHLVCEELNSKCIGIQGDRVELVETSDMFELVIRAIPQGSYEQAVATKQNHEELRNLLIKILESDTEELVVIDGKVGKYQGDFFQIKE